MSSIIRATTTSGLQVAPDNSGSLQLQTNGTTTAVTIDTSQNVGIGTTSPKNNSGYTTLTLNNASSGGVVEFTSNNTTVAQLYNTGTDFYTYSASGKNIVFDASGLASIKMNTNGTERMRIDSSGNVFINTTSTPADAATYLGIINAGGSNYGIAIKNSNASTNQAIAFFNNSGTRVGSVSFTTTATAFNTSSDYRLKEDVQPMVGALDKVSQLKPVTYKWKSNGSDGQGFIAHELQDIMPEAVTGEKDAVTEDGSINPQGIDTSVLVATLTAAIQEQQTIINDLKARIETLEAK